MKKYVEKECGLNPGTHAIYQECQKVKIKREEKRMTDTSYNPQFLINHINKMIELKSAQQKQMGLNPSTGYTYIYIYIDI